MDDNILEKIYSSVLKFLEPLKPEETYLRIVEEAIKLSRADEGSLSLEMDGSLKKVYSSSPSIALVKTRQKGFTYRAFKERRAFLIQREELLKAHPEFKKTDIKSTLFIPISYKNKSLGAITLQSYIKGSLFTTKELNVLKLFGSMASLAIRKTHLYDETTKTLEHRNEFISLAAHELRTPMTTISGYIQLLHSKLINQDSPESKWTAELLKESRRLTNIVSELVEANRLNAGKYHFNLNEIVLVEIIGKAIDRFLLLNNSHKIKFNCKLKRDNSIVIADQEKILMVINSLLDNAAKFSPSNSDIDLNLYENLKQIILEIRDYGKGMSKEELNNLFQSFRKEQTGSGLGLGLFLAKNILEKHKGLIEVKSKEGFGTTVKLKFPKIK